MASCCRNRATTTTTATATPAGSRTSRLPRRLSAPSQELSHEWTGPSPVTAGLHRAAGGLHGRPERLVRIEAAGGTGAATDPHLHGSCHGHHGLHAPFPCRRSAS